MKHKDITEIIIASAFKIHNALGYGFLEKVYKNTLLIELNYLKGTGIEVGLLINFGKSVEIKRKALDINNSGCPITIKVIIIRKNI